MGQPYDFGPIYTETDLSRFPVEPWNTFSNLAFLVIIISLTRKTKLNWRRHPVLVPGLVVLLIGFIGGTLYHATRQSSLFLVLDFMPIFLLAFAGAAYLWWLPSRKIIPAAVMSILPLMLFGLIRRGLGLPKQWKIGLGYIFLAIALVLPAVLHAIGNGFRHSRYLVRAVLSFGIGITFRSVDYMALLPMGTHFLWHLFGAYATWNMMQYILETDNELALGEKGK